MTTLDSSADKGGNGSDRRRSERFDTRLIVAVRVMKDGTTMEAAVTEISSNGMRITTPSPLPETQNIQIRFREASNNTHCEGRVVWTRPSRAAGSFDSGVDITRWGGDMPSEDFIKNAPNLRLKPDRRGPR